MSKSESFALLSSLSTKALFKLLLKCDNALFELEKSQYIGLNNDGEFVYRTCDKQGLEGRVFVKYNQSFDFISAEL